MKRVSLLLSLPVLFAAFAWSEDAVPLYYDPTTGNVTIDTRASISDELVVYSIGTSSPYELPMEMGSSTQSISMKSARIGSLMPTPHPNPPPCLNRASTDGHALD